MVKFKVWFEEKRRIAQYETLTVGIEREIDTSIESLLPSQALSIVKSFIFSEMPKALEEARKR